MDKNEFGSYLKKLREQRNLSLRQVNYVADISYSNLNKIENGERRATPYVLRQLSKVYLVDYLVLLEKGGFLDVLEVEKARQGFAGIPLLGVVKAGYDYLVEQNIIGYVDCDIKDKENCFALKIKGNSMEPILYENDIIIIRQQSDIESGQVAVVLVGNECTVKKVIKHDNCIELVAFNSYYPPRTLDKDFIIIGKVIEGHIRKVFE